MITRAQPEAGEIAASWLQEFGEAMEAGKAAAAARCLAADGHWRDVLAFTWDIGTVSGGAAIEVAWAARLDVVKPRGFVLPTHRSAPRFVRRAGVDCIEAIFTFETS
ncbi:MAG: monooxygenase, partial [Proteobacteria bacterium]|nr:monooxygenase [Pseudomonadota bacterium]